MKKHLKIASLFSFTIVLTSCAFTSTQDDWLSDINKYKQPPNVENIKAVLGETHH